MQNFAEFKKDLAALISFNSVKGERESGAPFGKETAGALGAFIKIAEKMGFKTINYDGYAAEVSYGDGEEIGIIGHLDVVPAGGGWSVPPFSLTEKNETLYGRGVCDDKGPLLAALYALNELKNSGIKCNKKFRLFAGTNEETGWQDLEYLKTKTALPEYGFSPDGNFPVSYSEKGVYILTFPLPELKNFCALTGGTAINAVCAQASVRAKAGTDLKLLAEYGLKEKDGIIESAGKAAHGSAPQNGINAFKALFGYMSGCGEPLYPYYEYLFCDSLGIMKRENEQGNLTFSPDIIEEKDGRYFLSCDCRVPAPMDFVKDVKPLFDETGLEFTFTEKHPPFMVPKDSEIVKKLLGAYNKVTGENLSAVKMGGSTFARAFRQGCSFGFEFPYADNHIHEADERISVELLLKGYEIIKTALFDLAK